MHQRHKSIQNYEYVGYFKHRQENWSRKAELMTSATLIINLFECLPKGLLSNSH